MNPTHKTCYFFQPNQPNPTRGWIQPTANSGDRWEQPLFLGQKLCMSGQKAFPGNQFIDLFAINILHHTLTCLFYRIIRRAFYPKTRIEFLYCILGGVCYHIMRSQVGEAGGGGINESFLPVSPNLFISWASYLHPPSTLDEVFPKAGGGGGAAKRLQSWDSKQPNHSSLEGGSKGGNLAIFYGLT